MKKFKLPLIISLTVHFLILGVLFLFRGEIELFPKKIEVTLESYTPEPYENVPFYKISSPSQDTYQTKPKKQPDQTDSSPHKHPLQPIFLHEHPSWQTLLERNKKKQSFLSARPKHPTSDSLIQHIKRYWTYQPEEAEDALYLKDDIGDIIEKRNMGTKPILLSTGEIAKSLQKPEIIKPKFDFIPTEIQVQAMKILYTNKKTTQVEMYSQLNPELPITAEGFNKTLEHLVKKGFLQRKKNSPENIFTIQTPLGAFPLELSKKNRLNPVYLYKPYVNPEKLMTYLQSLLYLHKERLDSVPTDSVSLNNRIRSLQQQIQILIN
jgi:hypothetical protein